MKNEPVAWMNRHDNHIVTFDRLLVKEAEYAGVDNWIPLYTHPAKTLTDEEILGAIARGWCSEKNSSKTMDSDLAMAIADEIKAILRKAQEK